VLVALSPIALTQGISRPRLSFAAVLVFACWIGIAGDSGLARAGAAGIAVAAAMMVCLRTADDVRLAAGVFGATAAAVAVVGAMAGISGARADVVATAAAIGMAASAGTGFWAVAACDLAGVLVLPSRAGLVAAALLLVALAHAGRRNVVPALAGTVVIASAWLARAPPAHAPFVHGDWRHGSGFADSYHRLGVVGAALFVLLIAALLSDLPRDLAPAAFAAAVGAALAPLETAAPLWLLAGLAAGGPAYDRAMVGDRDRRLEELERWLASQLSELDAERRRLLRRIAALDARELEVARHETAAAARAAELARRESAVAANERGVLKPAPAPAPVPGRESDTAPPPQRPPAPRPQEPAAPRRTPPRFRPTPPRQPLPSPAWLPQQSVPRWSFSRLEKLVEARLPEFPDREVEWRSFLALLEEHAVDDLLPESFDGLILEVFGPIIPA
jgi:hypothetical protein